MAKQAKGPVTQIIVKCAWDEKERLMVLENPAAGVGTYTSGTIKVDNVDVHGKAVCLDPSSGQPPMFFATDRDFRVAANQSAEAA